MTSKENFIEICRLTTSVLELPYSHLEVRKRTEEYMIPRAVACVIGRLENGTKHRTMSNVLGINRATIYYYEKEHHKRFKFWPKYRNTFNKVYLEYKNTESNKKVFVRSASIKNYLSKNGIADNDKPDLSILIMSGNVCTPIHTTYFDCSEQIKRIKYIMKDYKYELKLIDLNEALT